MTLNEVKQGFEKILAPTDSRYRSDVRELELGNLGIFFLDEKNFRIDVNTVYFKMVLLEKK